MITTDTGSSLAAAAVVSYVIGLMKTSNWRFFGWISRETPAVTRAVAIVLSGVASVGVHWTYSSGTLVVSGLSASAILTGLWHWGVQFAYTHGWFKATSQSGELLALIKKLIEAQQNAASTKLQPKPEN